MKPPSLVALALAASLALACNARHLGAEAPELTGAAWLQGPDGGAPDLDGRWVLVEFFAPT